MQDQINKFLQEIKKVVDDEIEKILHNDEPLIEGLYKSAAYSSTGGKRVRAVFINLIGGLFDVEPGKLLYPACAVEFIHAASLIMDDLPYMDDSQLRRGKPANHIVFGQDVALLASIALVSKATKIILSDVNLTENERNKVAAILTESYGFDGLAAGQFVDLKLKRKDIDFKIIEYINHKKTAALFTAAGQIAAVIGCASDQEKKAVQDFCQNIGFTFQIIDDMLDIVGDEKIVGKNLQHDKWNFVKLVGKDKAEKYLKEYYDQAVKALQIFGEKADNLRKFSKYLIERSA